MLPRTCLIALLAVALAWASHPARADAPDREACVQAYVDAQSARKAGELLRAKKDLDVCANSACPGMVQRDCSKWLDEVSRALPTVVLVARDASGRDLLDATATLDGTPVALDGKPMALDPGKHTVQVRSKSSEAAEQTFVVVEGEHDRAIVLTASTPPAAAPQPPPTPGKESAPSHGRTVPVASWVLGGVGVASLGAFTYFAVRGANDRSSLGCDHGCTSSAYDQVNGEFWAANIALGVGVACIGAAVALFLLSGDTPSAEAKTAASITPPLRFAF